MKLSAEQERALSAAKRWMSRRDKPWFYLAGAAGTGKSSLAKHFADGFDGAVRYCCYTGKAAFVLRQKGCENATTIHSLIYRAKDKSRKRLKELQAIHEASPTEETKAALKEEQENLRRPFFELNLDSDVRDARLLIIDEVSMLSDQLARDLLSFEVPLLVLGDRAQLPPVFGSGFFDRHPPDFELTEIHRQARDNPIIEMATRVREGRKLEYGTYGDSRVISIGQFQEERDNLPRETQVLVGMNRTRQRANERRRASLGFGGALPNDGDRLVCRRNNHQAGLLNGMIWECRGTWEDPDCQLWARLKDDCEGREIDAPLRREPFTGEVDSTPGETFEFGWALTVHVSQGSEWDDVVLVDEGHVFRGDANRWRYTGTTRASKRITIVR